ncbi:MAG TPA: hypothetical protein VIX37_11870 [Candidatus Sulfotelmatobacter sp.]
MRITRKGAAAAIAAKRKAAGHFADALFTGLVNQREQLTGQPSPEEIAKRLKAVAKEMVSYCQMEPDLTSDESRFIFKILLAREFWPECAPALDAALKPCFDIYDEAIVSVDVTNRRIDGQLLAEVRQKAMEIAARKAFQNDQAQARRRIQERSE